MWGDDRQGGEKSVKMRMARNLGSERGFLACEHFANL